MSSTASNSEHLSSVSRPRTASRLILSVKRSLSVSTSSRRRPPEYQVKADCMRNVLLAVSDGPSPSTDTWISLNSAGVNRTSPISAFQRSRPSCVSSDGRADRHGPPSVPNTSFETIGVISIRVSAAKCCTTLHAISRLPQIVTRHITTASDAFLPQKALNNDYFLFGQSRS